ncbi:uncharacterized protein LOC117336057 isoform X1 [Pecten maximus]|uniref:uncharacterized protein LOC117336057 isoform X1 n=1 Tax=Pecten maximus TaxID=6579 RepID=UPI0014587055|nr:uncharacterized protein LOC117336057 isoform X1 [Pecten maximus]
MAATMQLCPSLVSFRGSEGEAIVKEVISGIELAPGFFNLVIHCSNAIEGTSFTDAAISLRGLVETQRALNKDYRDGIPKVGLVKIKDILNMHVFEEFLEDGVKGIENSSAANQQAFLTLFHFLDEKKKHEQAIEKLLTSVPQTSRSKETIMVALAHHLFSQLVPGNKYEVDKYANQLPKECDCGCKAMICKGDTSVGSDGTWHGRVDIVLNHTIAVAVLKDQPNSDDEDEYNDTDEEGPPSKQRKACKNDTVLLERKVLNKVLAEAITNSFAQVNIHEKTLSHFLIPTFGATSEHITICLYDSENDYLLHIKDELLLWKPIGVAKQLNVRTLVVIWLFLNFSIFTHKKLHTLINLDKSGLHDELLECLELYKNTETKGKFVSSESSEQLWKSMAPAVKHRKKLQ